MKKIDIHSKDGCGLQGFNYSSYADLVCALGKPNCPPTLDGKIRVMWYVDTPVGCFTVYDYKETEPIEKITEWHIGGHSQAILYTVADELGICGCVVNRDGKRVDWKTENLGPDAYITNLAL